MTNLVKNPEELKIMAEAGRLLAGIMAELKKSAKPGVVSRKLDEIAEELILSAGAKPAFKNYQGFPASLCVSFNQQIVHGAPSERVIKNKDLLSLDLGLFYCGFYSDMAETIIIGRAEPVKRKLLAVCRKALEIAISQTRPGNRLGDLGWKIQKYVESQGFSVVRDLCGHGIGRKLHEDPQVLNYGKPGTGLEILEGMVFCLEPMITAGDWHIKKSSGGFAYEPKDGSLSCHLERMVLATKNGPKILTSLE